MVSLRDGRKLIGVLRSWDQFGTSFPTLHLTFPPPYLLFPPLSPNHHTTNPSPAPQQTLSCNPQPSASSSPLPPPQEPLPPNQASTPTSPAGSSSYGAKTSFYSAKSTSIARTIYQLGTRRGMWRPCMRWRRSWIGRGRGGNAGRWRG